MEEFYDLQTLPNGVRIVTEHVPAVRSACLGLWVGTGSRHEKAGEGGAAHFIEHMAFKGTERRTARQLAQEMDAIGATVAEGGSMRTRGGTSSRICWSRRKMAGSGIWASPRTRGCPRWSSFCSGTGRKWSSVRSSSTIWTGRCSRRRKNASC